MLPAVYTDLNSLHSLKAQGTTDQREKLEAAAGQFAALFVNMAIKSMRDAGLGEGLFDNEQSKLYTDLHDQQLALELGDVSGIADLLVAQLGAAESLAGTAKQPEDGTQE